MIYMWFTGINYYKLAVEKDRVTLFLRPCICMVTRQKHLYNAYTDTIQNSLQKIKWIGIHIVSAIIGQC